MAKTKKDNIELQQQDNPTPELYSNAALSNFSPYEFEITLGLASANYEGVRPVANLRISPQFAKEFAQMLVDNVRMYEENFGKIHRGEKYPPQPHTSPF